MADRRRRKNIEFIVVLTSWISSFGSFFKLFHCNCNFCPVKILSLYIANYTAYHTVIAACSRRIYTSELKQFYSDVLYFKIKKIIHFWGRVGIHVRGQPIGVGFSLLSSESWGSSSGLRLGSKHLSPLSHVAGPWLYFVKVSQLYWSLTCSQRRLIDLMPYEASA